MTELTDQCLLCHRAQRRCVALCRECRARVAAALAEAPKLYVRGIQGLPATSHALSEKLSQPRPGPTSPLRDVMLELCDDMARALAAWEAATKARAGLTTPSVMVRPGYAVQRSAGVVAAYLTEALAPPYGLAHARRTLSLTGALRERLGLNPLVHNLAAPCPRCNTRALIRRDGDDHVSCRLCGQGWPERHYALLSRLLVAEADEVRNDDPAGN